MAKTEERRSGEERRMEPPNCIVPCPTMIAEHEKITKQTKDLADCVRKVKEGKVANKLFYWCVGGLAFFVVVIVGGFQWKMLQTQHTTAETFLRDLGVIKTDIALSAQKLDRSGRDIDNHISKTETKFETMERRIENIQKQHNKILWEQRKQ